ncbi:MULTISPECIES: hypothetical protein [unclassified Microbacterium]|uniref:hypothetical protein n=1 Tax=unclassified Microbacterium TaxID=2609290 RepID=UPI000EA8F027|nr:MULTISPECIES: hypothetical protein [unclassified Microbacterium]MBT2483472.1 hypothetical protein [Microbacterium sp. ISL-108]RKN66492.1 hypothetical protein D7252_02030 [Microbacterium sp. CGR2]
MSVRGAKLPAAARVAPWLVGAALVVAAGAVTAMTPLAAALLDPFAVRGAAGDPIQSRTLVADVRDLSFADQVTVSDADWTADGNWLVVGLTVSAPTTEVDAAIGVASLEIDGRVYQASERPSTSLVDVDLRVGTETVGVLAFELPDDIESGTAELKLSGRYPTPELDDVVAFSVDLDAASTRPSIELEPPHLGSP